MAVVKADGYGHGACTVARAAVAARVAQSDSGTSLAAAAAALLGFTVVSSQKAADDALPVWWPVLALAVAAVGLFLLRRRFRRRNRQPVRSSGGRGESDNRTRVGRVTLQRMDNVGIVVESLDAAISFFAELGLELEGRAMIEGDWSGRVTGLRDQRVEIAMMRTPDGHGRIELSRFLAPPVVADHRNALGYLRVMFAVDDLDDTLARLRRHGAQLVDEVVQYEDVYRLCYVRGPEGILIGLAEQIGS
jgi:catechol 2,3-dioxygenase-like lactoylglutathione lyase family enzyme